MQPSDGVIKFSMTHHTQALPEWANAEDIAHWFGFCRAHNLIGQEPGRYGGAAYGNISQRAANGFIITGSQTGGHPQIGREHLCWVQSIDLSANQLTSNGPLPPSSESMTHDQVYRFAATTQFVIHVHSQKIWQNAARLGLPITDPNAEYGTQAMALEVERLLSQPNIAALGKFSMGGHEDGIVVFGDTAAQAGERLKGLLDQAC